jgi:type IV pilus assembly protein PilC
MFKDFGGTLPGPTQMVIDLSNAAQAYVVYIIIAIILFIVGFRMFLANPKGRMAWDSFILKMPVIGPLVRKVAVARFTRTLGTMISSGVPILDGLEVVAKTAGNKSVEAAIMFVRTKISEGKTIAAPLAETGVFPPMVVQMIGVGEATGAMDQMLNKIADFYDDEVDVAVGSLTSLLEPFIMVFLGGGVGWIVVAMYLPIFTMANAIH